MHLGLNEVKSNGFIYYQAAQFLRAGGVSHLYSSRCGGVSKGYLESLNLGFSCGDLRENVIKNYEILLSGVDARFSDTVCTKQVHGDHVLEVDRAYGGTGLLRGHDFEADALITQTQNLALVGYYADCALVLLYDPVRRAAGICHSGWRGTALRILNKTIKKMEECYGCRAQDSTLR